MKKSVLPIFIGITLILLIAGLSGCFGTEEESINEIDKFVGIWNLYGSDLWHELSGIVSINFSSDRNFTTDINTNGTYELKEGKLVLTMSDEERTLSFSYQFSDGDQRLTLIDSNENVAAYIKQ